MRNIKDKTFQNIRSKIFSLEKASNRVKMQKHGFIKPDHITNLDFKLSFAKSLEEEETIKDFERERDTDIQDQKLLEANYDDSNQNNDDSKGFNIEDEEKNQFTDLFIISRVGCFYQSYDIIQSIMCIGSSYWYSWMACFGNHFDPKTFL